MEYIDLLFQNGGETYTKEEMLQFLSQYMSDDEATSIISIAEQVGFIYLANSDKDVNLYVR